ncbi:prolyl-tRNA synthetase [bacterium]|nr:prolyl-tRNA synthetase [bacterium]
MRQSLLFTKTKKEVSKEEESVNARLLIKAGFIDKTMAGVFTFLPLGLIVLKKIENIIRQEMNKLGAQEILMPALQPKEIWQKTNRWQIMDDLYKLKDRQGREIALGPTHEEVITPLMKKFISTYRDLPCFVYQIQNKFRQELRAKAGLLRGREFIMKDLYSFHADEEDLDKFYQKVIESYFKIFERLGIRERTFLTYAAGGSFSKYSHEFQTITPAGEDTIYICQKCQLAINKEIKEETLSCPNCQGTDFSRERAIEVGNIFKLGKKFSQSFDLSFFDREGNKSLVVMGCYGIGLNRLLGTIVEVNYDEKGIIWPKEVAPFLVHLLVLGKEREVLAKGEEIYQKLKERKIEVLYDDRKDKSSGEKLVESDLLGLPLRLVVSKRTLEKKRIGLKLRREKEERMIAEKDLAKYLF